MEYIKTQEGGRLELASCFRRYAVKLEPRVWAVEHFILGQVRMSSRRPLDPIHVAVVVLTDGDAFIGRAKLDNAGLDIYNRRRGYHMAMGRAFKRAYTGDIRWWSHVPTPLAKGVELRDQIREMISTDGTWKSQRAPEKGEPN